MFSRHTCRWEFFNKFLKGAEAKKMLADIKERFSDHLPIVHRFFYRPNE
jgi:hypothetical protein